MSGSGGSGSGGGGTFSDDDVPCDRLFINTQLSSPQPGVVPQLQVNDELDVTLQVMSGTTVVVALYNGTLAGGLASPETARLRRCIESGTVFQATVIAINGGQVRVRVHPA